MFWKRRERISATGLGNGNFDNTIEDNNLVLVFFEAPWCGACKMLHPIVNDLADENRDREVIISAVNTDQERELAQRFSIRSLPTLVVFKNQEKVFHGPGMISKPRLQEMIDTLIAQ